MKYTHSECQNTGQSSDLPFFSTRPVLGVVWVIWPIPYDNTGVFIFRIRNILGGRRHEVFVFYY